jgi:hypothetical protein
MFCWLRLSVSIVVVALAALPFAHAKSGVVHLQNRYNSQHISSLPAEVQNAIAHYATMRRASSGRPFLRRLFPKGRPHVDPAALRTLQLSQ